MYLFLEISSVVTTKVKGQGFVPINKLMERYNKADVRDYKKLFEIKAGQDYKILDTAGKISNDFSEAANY